MCGPNRRRLMLAALILSCSAETLAQTTATTPAVSIVFAILTKSAESKSATAGQEFILRTVSDVSVGGEVVIPKGSKLSGHITAVELKGAGAAQSSLSIVVEKALLKDGAELPLQAIIVAVAAPREKASTPDPTYGMLHSSEPKMVGLSPGSGGELPSNSRAGKSAEATAADIKGGAGEPLLLKEDSQGAVGYEGLSVSWRLDAPPPVTVFSNRGKNVKLEEGTQMLLRMAAPRPTPRKP